MPAPPDTINAPVAVSFDSVSDKTVAAPATSKSPPEVMSPAASMIPPT